MNKKIAQSAETRKNLHTGNLFLSLLSTLFVVSGAFAIDPDIPVGTTSGACEDGTLNTDSGSANLEINWAPNEIALHWYSDGEELTNIPTESQSCTYDGTLTPPSTIPTKTGYTFKGWHVRIPTYDFATIPDVNGTKRWSIGWYNNANYCWYNGGDVSCGSDNTYTELQTYEWKVKYSHGDLYGTSMCSTASGTYGQPGTPSDTDGKYCWCKATGYKVGGTDVIRKPLSVLSWVYYGGIGYVAGCARICADNCAAYVQNHDDFRRAVFAGQ